MADFMRDAETLPGIGAIRIHSYCHAASAIRHKLRVWTMEREFPAVTDPTETGQNFQINRHGRITERRDVQLDEFAGLQADRRSGVDGSGRADQFLDKGLR